MTQGFSFGDPADLLLNKRKLLQVALQERHLLLLRLAVTIANDVVVLFFHII